MSMMRRALRENNWVTAVSMVAISSALLLLGLVLTTMLSLETKLLALSLLWVGLYLLQRVVVGKRRSSGHWFIQYTAMAAYYLPTPVVFSAARALYYYSTSDSDITPWLVFSVVFMFYRTIKVSASEVGVLFTNMTVYSICDRPRDRCNFVMWLVFLGCVDWEWARISSPNWPGRVLLLLLSQFCMAFYILFVNTSESTLDCQTKAVADYMNRESSKSSSTSPFFDDDDDVTPNSNSSQQLDCCRYPFEQEKDGVWVTVKDLVQRVDLPNEHQDILLSYSLSRLLARRYYGFHCAEEGDTKVRRFALAHLGTRSTDGNRTAFTIVEVQLAFLHDYFFTASLPIIKSGLGYIGAGQKSTIAFVGIISMLLGATAISMPDGLVVGTITIKMLVAVVLCMFLLWCVLFGMPMWLLDRNLLAIYWRPIHTAFRILNYLPDCPQPPVGLVRSLFRPSPNPNMQDLFDPFQTQTDGIYWKNKIGQYSILQDYDRSRSLKKALVAWFQGIMLSQPSYEFIKHLPVEEEEVDMKKLDNVRELVADTLRAIDGPPTNGTRSLKINMDEVNRDEISEGSAGYDWLLTCKQETHTDTILIWHIATCYCDMSQRHSDPSEEFPLLVETETCRKVAMALSRYCTYLVAFLPELLLEHILTTKQVFQRVLQEAQDALGTTPMEEKEKYTKMQELLLPHQHEQQTTFHKGVDLGRQLEMLKHGLRWKLMAEFWAETILYVAPSNNAEAHIEQLAKGGEFITHLWAMLSNAGILKRAEGEWHPPPVVTATEERPTQQLPEAMSPSDDGSSTSSGPSPRIQTSELAPNGEQPEIMQDT